MSLAESEDRNPYLIVGMLCQLRYAGKHSDEEIAGKLGFESAEQMQFQLETWNIPSWLIGEKRSAATLNSAKRSNNSAARRARGSGPPTDLPPASRAAALFRERLEVLGRAAEGLQHRKEKLQGGRFIESSVNTGPVSFSRDLMSEEQWRYVQEVCGLGADAKGDMLFGGATWGIGGGTATPAEPLPALIGAYLLAGGEVEPLVQALHPDPSSAEWQKIRKRIEDKKTPSTEDGIIAIAQQLAKAVRGGELKRGRSRAELSNHEINLASRITELREQGWADEDILRKLQQMPNSFAQGLSWGEFQRLADLEQRFPWS